MTTGFSFKPLWVRLEVAQRRLIDELEQLKADRQGSSPWAKEDERAIEISEVERRSALEARLRNQLAEIEHALRKRDQGTYGLCDNCGQPINLGRLEALPQANLCLNCKAHEEGRKRQSDSGRIDSAYEQSEANPHHSVDALLEYYERAWEDEQKAISARQAISTAVSAGLKRRWQDPEYRAKLSAARKALWQNPEFRAKQSAARKILWQNPEFRAKQSAALKRRGRDPEYRAKLSTARKTLWQDPSYRAKQSAATKRLWQDPEYQIKLSAARKTLWQDPEFRAKQSIALSAARKRRGLIIKAACFDLGDTLVAKETVIHSQ